MPTNIIKAMRINVVYPKYTCIHIQVGSEDDGKCESPALCVATYRIRYAIKAKIPAAKLIKP